MKLMLMSIVSMLSTMAFAHTPQEIPLTTKGGLIVVIDAQSPQLLTELCVSDAYHVQGLYTDRKNVETAREYLHEQARYGQISVAYLAQETLPYIDNLINAVVVDGGTISESEINRVLCPGGRAYLNGQRKVQKPWPNEIDQWGHFLHGPDNNAVANDQRVGPPRSLVWTHSRRWLRSHEELASISAMVSTRGRLLYIVDKGPLNSLRYSSQWKLIARDAFNGTTLWEKDIPLWNDQLRIFRSGPTHLPRRLVAQGDKVYVTLGFGAPVVQIDGATGDIIREYKQTEHTEEIITDGKTLYLMVGTSESRRSGPGLFERNEPAATESRELVALDIDSGTIQWKRNARGSDYILPLGYALCNDRIYLHSITGVHCLDAKSGKELWKTPRPSPSSRYSWSTSTLVATKDIVLLVDRNTLLAKNAKSRKGVPLKPIEPAKTDPSWIVSCFPDSNLPFRATDSILTAYSAEDGKVQWTQTGADGYNASVDLFVIDNIVWVGSFNSDDKRGYDLRTGEPKATLAGKGERVGMAHHRCYRNKASSNFIFTGRDGIEILDLKKGSWTSNNSWVRGTCQYGILPANGYLYAPPNACACHPKVKLQGMNALSARLPSSAVTEPDPIDRRLEEGPAFHEIGRRKPPVRIEDDWPMYRHDPQRSGAVPTSIGEISKPVWSRSIGGRLTQPVCAFGVVITASVDTHTLYAFDSASGQPRWRFTADARIDSSPTLYRGTVLFGSADGYVYCLNAEDGELAWRFRAAPENRYIAIYGQLESSWPVHGSVLVQDGELYVIAGRSTYLDGGLYFYRMDPKTGIVLSNSIIRHLDPTTGKQTTWERKFDSGGSLNDILSGDGESVHLKHMRFDKEGNELSELADHLFTPGGFLGEQWFVRSYWTYGTNTGAGWGGWTKRTGQDVTSATPAGRIMSFDDNAIYGYGRVQHLPRQAGHRMGGYHLFSSAFTKGTKKDNVNWSKPDFDLTVRAMVLTSDSLIVAGFPDVAQNSPDGNAIGFANEEEAYAAFTGKRGAFIYLISSKTGERISKIELSSVPVFDGMCVAHGRVYLSTRNGSLTCLGTE